MKKSMFIFVIFLAPLLNFAQPKGGNSVKGMNFLSQHDAEKILGQPARLTDSSTENKDNAVNFRCTYTANEKEKISGKLGHLYFMFEHYNNEAAAKAVYADIVAKNRGMSNFNLINKIGDESLRHTDNENFDLVIFRKGKKIVRLKVNKLTSMTSINDLQLVAKRISLNL